MTLATLTPSIPAYAATSLTIREINARAVIAPLTRAVRTAVGTIPAAPLVLIDVATNEGPVGRSYLFGYTPPALGPIVRFIQEISPELIGKPVAPFDRMQEFDRRFRLIGWQGLIGMALSGLDMAFWDALGRAADQPLVSMLGGVARPLPAYDSYGMIDLKADAPALEKSLEQGFKAIKIKLGGGEADADVAIVKAVRDVIGEKTVLMADYNQSLDPPEAVRRIERLAEFNLHWIEEPVHAADYLGHAYVRERSSVPIQTGENWWFPRDMANAIALHACDYAMLDIMKIGGVTGWMRAAGQAEAASLPVSSHLFIEASAHMLAVTPTVHWLEYLDVAGSILVRPPTIDDGTVTAEGPGLGIEWDEKAVAKFIVT